MSTVFDLTLAIARALGQTKGSKATGGTTSTLVDTVFLRQFDNDLFNNGTIWVTEADSAAPEGEMRVVQDFNSSSKTITVANAFSGAPASGDRYVVASDRFTVSDMLDKINLALGEQGMIPKIDTSLTTTANTRNYDLPEVGVSLDLRQVLWQTDTTLDTYTPVANWEVRHQGTGSVGKLVLPYDLPTGRTLLLHYAYKHAELAEYTDTLDATIHPSRIIYRAAAGLLRDYMDRTRLNNYRNTVAQLEKRATEQEAKHPLPVLPPKDGTMGVVSLGYSKRGWNGLN